MDTKEALLKLFKIAQKQQKVLEKLAQAAAPPVADGAALAARILAEAKKSFPQVESYLNSPLQVLNLNNPGELPAVTARFRSGPDSANLRKALDTAATAILGAGKYRLALTGEF